MRQKEMLLKKLKQHSTSVSPRPDPEPEELLASEVVASEVVSEVAPEVVSEVASEVVSEVVPKEVAGVVAEPAQAPKQAPKQATMQTATPMTMQATAVTTQRIPARQPEQPEKTPRPLRPDPLTPTPRGAPWAGESPLSSQDLYYEQLVGARRWLERSCTACCGTTWTARRRCRAPSPRSRCATGSRRAPSSTRCSCPSSATSGRC